MMLPLAMYVSDSGAAVACATAPDPAMTPPAPAVAVARAPFGRRPLVSLYALRRPTLPPALMLTPEAMNDSSDGATDAVATEAPSAPAPTLMPSALACASPLALMSTLTSPVVTRCAPVAMEACVGALTSAIATAALA